MWTHHETGIAMSAYLWAATCGSPSGFLAMSFVAEHRGWREVFWALFGVCGAFFREIRPAAGIYVVAGLLKPEMKVEIEVTARMPGA